MRKFQLVLLCVLLTLAAAPLFAQAVVLTENSTVPIEFTGTSCTGEPIIIFGESHLLVHAVGNPNQSVFITHINFNLEGTTASGVHFVVNEAVNSTTTGTEPAGPFTFTSVGRLRAISTNSEENFYIDTVIHTTINANGEVTAMTFEFETRCQ